MSSPLDRPEVEEIKQIVRDIVAKVSPPARIHELDEAETYDEALWTALAEAGLVQLGAESDGSASASHLSQAAVLEELGASATSMAVSFVVQYMGVSLLGKHGTAEQRARVLEPLVVGEGRVAFALTEPDGGTDVVRVMRTQAERVADGWRIRGAKLWISGAIDCKHLIVLARTSESSGSSVSGVTMFLVPRDAAGVSVSELNTMAIHGLSTCEVGFDDVLVGEDAVLGEVDRGFHQVLGTLNGERLNAAAVAVGIGRGALDAAVDYATARQAFGRPIGTFQALQHRLATGAIHLESARSLLYAAATAADTGEDAAVLSAMAKVAASDAATELTDTGMRVMGGSGLSREYPMQRFFRDARLYTFAPLTDEMMRNFIAERYLGLPRSY
ncbi:acyl-CoA dehydrogenase family protein [Gryllotalpicola sp.]|uniref:acyl-CoA dehydrogenase family protein n=1 Tax=Gryllotalpicola sp. TaxID=1932787 RepID=UPI002631DFAF|nr:acyl-CoA dehydrogenase family protein [Gryllotalpicola sp.]